MADVEAQKNLVDVNVEDITNPRDIKFYRAERAVAKSNESNEKDDPEVQEAKKIIEEWWDIRQIKKLTFDLAEQLIQKYQWDELNLEWLTVIDQDVAFQLSYYKWKSLNLNKITSVDEGTAYRLWQFEWENLNLSWVTSLNERKAWWLHLFGWKILRLDSVTSLDKMSAENIAKFEWWMLVLWIKSMDNDVATWLSQFKWDKLVLENAWDFNEEITSVLKPIQSKLLFVQNNVAIKTDDKLLNNAEGIAYFTGEISEDEWKEPENSVKK